MKKKLSKVLIALLLAGCVAGATPAMAAEANPAPAETTTGDGAVTPMADEFTTYYRYLDGKLQYRIWNATQGYWVNDWTYA